MALDQFLDAEVRPTPRGVRVDVLVSLWNGGQVKTMTRPDAEAALRRLDLALHPWGAPGVVPAEPGEYWASNGSVIQACENMGNYWWWRSRGDDRRNETVSLTDTEFHAQDQGWQFRRRWTPEGPVTP